MRSIQYAAVVAGAGPAGLAVVGNLLDAGVSEKILWVDPDFKGGRLNKQWREVPSNTKAGLFVDYANALESFRNVTHDLRAPNALSKLEELPRDKGCSISHAADMCLMLTEGVRHMPGVDTTEGEVSGASFSTKSNAWTVEFTNHDTHSHNTVAASRLILCTGSSPSEIPVPVPGLDITKITLDTALTPSQLSPLLSEHATIGVVGASHSAILVLLNLFNLASTSHPSIRIYWFTRSPLRYAEYMEDWIRRDNTGLKGLAAGFATEQLEDDKLANSPAGKFITKIDTSGGHQQEQEQYEKYLPECSHVVQATGFRPNAMPMLVKDGQMMGGVKYDNDSGGFTDNQGTAVKGLFGAGIAFPQRVTDPEGTVEYAVGLFKFMKYLKKVTKSWLNDGQEARRTATYTSTGGAPQEQARL